MNQEQFDPSENDPSNYKQEEANEQIMKNIQYDICQAIKINQTIYSQIRLKSPSYYKALRVPSYSSNQLDYKDIKKKYMLIRQLDCLLEEKIQLTNYLNHINFSEQENKHYKQYRFDRQCNLYSFLRTIWKRKFIELSAQDKIQKINKSVAYIKGHVQSLLQKQMQSSITLHQAVQKSEQYINLKARYQQLLMQKQDYKSEISGYKDKCRQLEDSSQKLHLENKKLTQEIQSLKEKNRILEKKQMKTQMKISTLEEQSYNKGKEIDRINKERKYIFRHHLYQIHIFSKQLHHKQQFSINKNLESIINYLKESKDPQVFYSSFYDDNSAVLGDYKSNNNKVDQLNLTTCQIKKRLNILQIPLPNSSRNQIRIKQINANLENQAKKARFVRQSSRHGRQNSMERKKSAIFIRSQTCFDKTLNN